MTADRRQTPSHNGDDDVVLVPLHIQRASVTGAAAPVPLKVTDVIPHIPFVRGICARA